jgi:hypothetical protein
MHLLDGSVQRGPNFLGCGQRMLADAVIPSDGGRAQHLAPMLNPFFQRALATIRKFIEIDLFEDPEGEIFGPMKVPGGLKRPVGLDALPQGERAAGPDCRKIGRRADPSLVGRRASDRIDSGDGLALFIGRDGGLAFASVHRRYPNCFFGARGSGLVAPIIGENLLEHFVRDGLLRRRWCDCW